LVRDNVEEEDDGESASDDDDDDDDAEEIADADFTQLNELRQMCTPSYRIHAQYMRVVSHATLTYVAPGYICYTTYLISCANSFFKSAFPAGFNAEDETGETIEELRFYARSRLGPQANALHPSWGASSVDTLASDRLRNLCLLIIEQEMAEMG